VGKGFMYVCMCACMCVCMNIQEFSFSFNGEMVRAKGVGNLVLSVKDWDAMALLKFDHVGEVFFAPKRAL